MRAAFLLLLTVLVVVVTAGRRRSVSLPKLDNDHCPTGCMNGTDAMVLQARIATCEAEQESLRHLIRNPPTSGGSTTPGEYHATDVLSGLLAESDKMSRAKEMCTGCIKAACNDPAVTRYITDATEVLVYDGRRVHHCKGCKCTFREIAEHTREQHKLAGRHRVSRTVVEASKTFAVITDHGLYRSGNQENVLDGLPRAGERALSRRLRHDERDCFEAPLNGNYTIHDGSIMEHRLGPGTIRTYMAQMNDDMTLGRLSVFVYRHA